MKYILEYYGSILKYIMAVLCNTHIVNSDQIELLHPYPMSSQMRNIEKSIEKTIRQLKTKLIAQYIGKIKNINNNKIIKKYHWM